ncbi:MAG: hypothetical protein J7647_23550 [Cyanobacteria bacterium SBLK]|nr:hypothetical protein [Cyanobacteria bacterium SBLK]
MTQTFTQHLSPEAIDRFVDDLPDYIKIALLKKSSELECPLEATIEMAIANFLDEEALSFEDCLLSQRLQK